MRTYKVKEISFIKGDDDYNNMKIKGLFKVIEDHKKDGWLFEKITCLYNPGGILNLFIHFDKEDK